MVIRTGGGGGGHCQLLIVHVSVPRVGSLVLSTVALVPLLTVPGRLVAPTCRQINETRIWWQQVSNTNIKRREHHAVSVCGDKEMVSKDIRFAFTEPEDSNLPYHHSP